MVWGRVRNSDGFVVRFIAVWERDLMVEVIARDAIDDTEG